MPSHAPLRADRRAQSGFSLIELMVAMLLGFLVVGAAGAVFLSNKRTYGATETLGRIQEGTRISFELMSRDIREAGGNPCSSQAEVVNQLVDSDDAWWTSVADGVRGYGPSEAMGDTTQGTATGNRSPGTDAIEMHTTTQSSIRVTAHDDPGDDLTVSSIAGVEVGDVLMVCNMNYSAVFEATGVSGLTVQHDDGGENCSGNFFFERTGAACPDPTTDIDYCFMVDDVAALGNCEEGSATPALVAHVQTIRWFVRNNADGTRSLMRQTVLNRPAAGAAADVQTDEIAQAVEDLDFQYLVAGDDAFIEESAVADWDQVISVRAVVTIQGTGAALEGQLVEGTDGEELERQVTSVVALRNRENLQ